MIKESLFYAKILLFGEYGIIEDSMGLSIPYNFYKGKLIMPTTIDEVSSSSNRSLATFCAYLKEVQQAGNLLFEIDLERLEQDITKGMYFDSTIPQGFGVGSSGALCAALYSKYAIAPLLSEENMKKEHIVELKDIFSQMESFFHGKSSGIDPLICYLNLPLLIKSKSEVGTIGIPESNNGKGAIFLLNSGQPGETQPMVNIFMEQCKQEGFRKMLKEQFITCNNDCIKSFLKRDIKLLLNNVRQLSKLLLENFAPMIPSAFHKHWKQGIETNAYYLKLCGSGGGGFVLGFTENYEKAKKLLKNQHLEIIYRF
jgi:mevalonate kinase